AEGDYRVPVRRHELFDDGRRPLIVLGGDDRFGIVLVLLGDVLRRERQGEQGRGGHAEGETNGGHHVRWGLGDFLYIRCGEVWRWVRPDLVSARREREHEARKHVPAIAGARGEREAERERSTQGSAATTTWQLTRERVHYR